MHVTLNSLQKYTLPLIRGGFARLCLIALWALPCTMRQFREQVARRPGPYRNLGFGGELNLFIDFFAMVMFYTTLICVELRYAHNHVVN